ncbi:hypothetical protein GC209_06330 [bacterium]|nr:hypothetical protein [bacterium]
MALDSKKVAAEVAQFKKSLADADRVIKQVEDAYKAVLAEDAEMAAAAKDLISDIASARNVVESNLEMLKSLKAAAKKVTGDVEMILRKFNDDYAAMQQMGETFFELDKELKKDKSNKDLIKKHEIAEKALERQSAAFAKTASEAGTIQAAIATFTDDLGSNSAWSLSAIATISKNMKELADIIEKKKRFLKEIEKAKGRW